MEGLSDGSRNLLVYCISEQCHHSVTMHGDWLPDETPVRSALPPKVPMCDGIEACMSGCRYGSFHQLRT
jgi:hypothetical protein